MAIKSNSDLKQRTSRQYHDYVDSFLNRKPGENTLPTTDPGVAGEIFITASAGTENLGDITGSGFSFLAVSQGS
jgi:hypothetical protein